jgi:hypothetical protein
MSASSVSALVCIAVPATGGCGHELVTGLIPHFLPRGEWVPNG